MSLSSRAALSLRSYDGQERRHAHEFTQIVLAVTGAMEMEVTDTSGLVNTEHGVLVTDRTPHRFSAAGNNRFVVLDLPPESAITRAGRVSGPFFAVDSGLSALVRHLAWEAAAGPLDPTTTHHAVSLLLRALERRTPAPSSSPPPVDRAIALMRADPARPLTVTDMAEAAGLAPSRFHDMFRHTTGQSPARYLTGLRLALAEELLVSSSRPIVDIALAVGFSDQSALTRCLRRHRATTPAALRRAAQGKR